MHFATRIWTVLLAAVVCGAASAQDVVVLTPEYEARTLRNQHADLSAKLGRGDLNRLQQIWMIKTENPVSHTPLINNGRVYFGDWGGAVYAADAKSGKVLWRKQLEKPHKMWPWHGFAGTGALGAGALYIASVEGNVFALKPETGEVIWRQRVAEDPQAGVLAKLTYYDGLLYVGLQSVEEPMTKMKKGFKPDFQGKVMALEALTGKRVWERRLVEPPHNGVAVWTSFALDPELGMLYFTTGNNYTGKATELSDALVAVEAKTGEIRWAQQVTQHDVWTPASPEGPDYDFGGGPQLFEATIGGKPRRLVGAGQKSGYFFAWDRQTGEPVWKTSIGYSAVDGGIHGEASIGDGRILAWSNNSYHHVKPPKTGMVSIKALDAATGRQLWVRDKAQPALLFSAGFLANDVYFLPSLDGRVRAYSAADGKQLWASGQHSPIISPLWIDEGILAFGMGVPGVLKWAGKGENGVVAYAPRAAAQGKAKK